MKYKYTLPFLLFFPFWLFGQQHNSFDFEMDIRFRGESSLQSIPAEVILQLEERVDPEQFMQTVDLGSNVYIRYERAIAPKYGIHHFIISRLLAEPTERDLAKLDAHPDVISAEWNEPVEFRDSIPNDPQWGDAWSLEHIGLPKVWDLSTGGHTTTGDEIVVAILDSGFDVTHEDLQGNLWENAPEMNGQDGIDDDGNGLVDDFHGWNYEQDTNNLYPVMSNGHGTSVAGIIGAKGNNGMGVTGANWDVKMMLFTVRQKDEVIAAFNYIVDQRELYNSTNGQEGAFIVASNTSFGIDGSPCENSPAWAAMYEQLGQAGVLNIAATANKDWDVDKVGDMPTSCPSDFLVTVTATDKEDERLEKAAFGETTIDLAAPGDTIVTTTLNQDYLRGFGGTSAATPHVTGTVALLYSLPCDDLMELARTDPAAAALLMKDALVQNVESAFDLRGKTVSGGRLDAWESMKHIHSWCIGLEQDRMVEQVKEVYLDRRSVVHVYPNPARGTVTVHFAALDFDVPVRFRVVNALGQEMYLPENGLVKPFQKQQFDIDVSDWPNGLYVVNILDNTLKLAVPFLKL